MAPWEALAWFQTPKATTFLGPFMAPQKIAAREPARVALIMGAITSAGSINISLDPAVTNSTGLTIGSQAGPFVLTQAEHGALCQAEWWASQSSGNVWVAELLVRDWPQETPPAQDTLVQAIGELSRLIRRLTDAIHPGEAKVGPQPGQQVGWRYRRGAPLD